jgi:hypothetical protein
MVDMGHGSALSGLVTRPRRIEQVMREEDANRAPGLVGDGLALARFGV